MSIYLFKRFYPTFLMPLKIILMLVQSVRLLSTLMITYILCTHSLQMRSLIMNGGGAINH